MLLNDCQGRDLRGYAETAGGARSAPSVGERGREVFHVNRSISVRLSISDCLTQTDMTVKDEV